MLLAMRTTSVKSYVYPLLPSLFFFVFPLGSNAAEPITLSFDPELQNECVRTVVDSPFQAFWTRSDCSLGSRGNVIFVAAKGEWQQVHSWSEKAADMSCNTFFIDYPRSNPSLYMYGQARDCTEDDDVYRNIGHTQTTRLSVDGIPDDLYVDDVRYPKDYTLSAKVAVSEISADNFARVALVYHLETTSGEDLFSEFDIYDSSDVPVCTDSQGRKWSAACPNSDSTVVEKYKHFGQNIVPQTWTTYSVTSSEVKDAFDARSDIDWSTTRIAQVYTVMELKGAYGQLQTKKLRLSAPEFVDPGDVDDGDGGDDIGGGSSGGGTEEGDGIEGDGSGGDTGGGGSGSGGGDGDDDEDTQQPVLTTVTPEEGRVGTEVTIIGDNFSPAGNQVHFGKGAISDLGSSQNGTQLTFIVPKGYTPYCEEDVCPMMYAQVTPGTYDVYVTNAEGEESNIREFVVSEDFGDGVEVSSVTSNVRFASNMWPGLENDLVRTLQQTLANDPTLYPEGLVTGYYGTLTEAAVKRFQCRYDIVCAGTPMTTGYGSVGPKTRAKLNDVYGGASDHEALRKRIDQLLELIAQLQAQLNARTQSSGYAEG